ncbi:MAG: uracil/xanthine transporter [Alicyclobacillus herbarius]|uniref:uracil/xanthine transporter n=1 Tax=Alicyclobacillus herbarius TaxID=122960 RepID=UPI002356A245|nr:uracil/xanthine transporter [Alicyclobacillus herbarius]MCL6631885.1 uracil/xanthine transporter [Alicyclobacillus herbarius]
MFTPARFVTFFAALQWLGFMFANTVVIPLSVGHAFQLTPEQISGAMARSFILTGAACLVQAAFGHRLPLMEGQSGLWWGVVLTLCSLAHGPGALKTVGSSLEIGMVLGGVALAVCAVLGLHRLLNRWFTPVTMAVLLILLGSQLVDIFFKGMVGVTESGKIQPGVASWALLVSLLVAVLTIAGKGLLSNFSILIGLSIGWVGYVIFFGSPAAATPPFRHMADWFVWGDPSWNSLDVGILLTAIVTALINTTNTIATLRAAEPTLAITVTDAGYRRSLLVSGLFTALSGPLAQVAYAPYTSTIGFLRTTRLVTKAPFLLGAALFVVMGLLPPVAGFFSRLPVPIGDAVLMVAYLQLFGSALQNLEGITFHFKSIYRIAAPVLLGLAIQTLPAAAFSSLPQVLRAVLSNGMLVGVLMAVILENVIPWHRFASGSQAPQRVQAGPQSAGMDQSTRCR